MTTFTINLGTDGDATDAWALLTEDEAIEAAVEKYGQDETTSVAYCALRAWGDGAEHQFWFDLFLKLVKASHVGWA
jgi:hypothetical protein